MKKDWSVFRITVLLYVIVVLLPLSYYFAMNSFKGMQNDSETMNRLVYINGTIQRVGTIDDNVEREQLIATVEESFKVIDNDFLQAQNNAEYVKLFHVNEGYESVIQTWIALKMSLADEELRSVFSAKCWGEVNTFSKMTEEMLAYKSETMLDRLYLSLLFTMIAVIVLVYFVRLYIRIQIQKYAIHDHVTGLYNKKYFHEALQKAKQLANRQEKPLSLIVVSINKYDEVKKGFDNKQFEAFLLEFGRQFREFFRQSDTICRVEENCFVAISPEANLDNENQMALRLEKHLSNHHFQLKAKVNMHVGVSSYHKDSGMPLLEEALEVMKRRPHITVGGDS